MGAPRAETQLPVVTKDTTAHNRLGPGEGRTAGVRGFDHTILQRVATSGQLNRAVLRPVRRITEPEAACLDMIAADSQGTVRAQKGSGPGFVRRERLAEIPTAPL